MSDHFQKAAATVMILLVRLQMLGKIVDALGKNSNLNLRRTRIGGMCLIGRDDILFDFLLQDNNFTSIKIPSDFRIRRVKPL